MNRTEFFQALPKISHQKKYDYMWPLKYQKNTKPEMGICNDSIFESELVENPENPENPEISKTPETPETPKTPEVSKTPETPETPEVSKIDESVEIDQDFTKKPKDNQRRSFLKIAGIAGLGVVASTMLPKNAEAYVLGSTPSASVVGVKNSSNTRINPATEETIASLASGQAVEKLSINLASSSNVLVPSLGNRIRVYASRFSLTADATSVSFRFTSIGADHEKYVSPKAGGLYGANNHPNYIEGGLDEGLYCDISGITTVQINIDYLEI